MKKYFLIMLLALGLMSCTDAEWEKNTNFGNKFLVEMYSGGKLVRNWISSGKVNSENGSDGYYFKDSKTDKLVEISGDIVITNISEIEIDPNDLLQIDKQ